MASDPKSDHVRQFFELLTASDTEGIIELFEEDARVHSLFLSEMIASEFFKKPGSSSAASKLTVFDVLLGEKGESAAAYFEYNWTLKSGERVVFQGVDHFEFGEIGRFASMSIFYDTHPFEKTSVINMQ